MYIHIYIYREREGEKYIIESTIYTVCVIITMCIYIYVIVIHI